MSSALARRLLFTVLVSFCMLIAAPTAIAADPYRIAVTSVDTGDYPTVRLVASVSDAGGHPAKGIRATDVAVSEDGRPVAADVRLASAVTPVSVALAIDTSGSMASALVAVKTAATAFIGTLGPADRAALVTFGTSATLAQDLTADVPALDAAVATVGAVGNTALYDGVGRALDVISRSAPTSRRAIVVLSDGADTSSASALTELTVRLAAAGLPVFVVALGDRIERGPLDAIASATPGGRVFVAPTPADLASIYDGLAEQLRSDLAITYRSGVGGGVTRLVAIELRSAGVVVARTALAVAPPPAPSSKLLTTAPPALVPIAAPVTNAPNANTAIGIGLLGASAMAAAILGVHALGRERADAERRRRLQEFVATEPERPRGGWRPAAAAIGSLRRMALPFRRVITSSLEQRTREWLVRAGEPWGLDALEFVTIRFALLAVLGIGAGLALLVAHAGFLFAGLAATLGALLGYAIPGVALTYLVRRRRREMSRALPGALDMLALSTAAGLTLDGGIAQVAERWATSLSDELRRYLAEVRIGRDRRESLHALGERVDLPEMAHLTSTLLQADVLGVPIADVLREQAAELRRERRQHAEELARLAPVKMLFPMALLIFPALFVVILGPVVPVLLKAFSS